MIEVEGVDPAKIRLIPNGIPSPANGAGADVRAELGIEPGAPVLGVVCELRAQKALEVLFEAAALLLGEFPTLKVLVAGDGPERARLEEEARRLGVADTVLFLGIRRDVPAVLAAVDVAVLSSDYEGSPLSVMEYMAAAKPVVSTRVGGVPELVAGRMFTACSSSRATRRRWRRRSRACCATRPWRSAWAPRAASGSSASSRSRPWSAASRTSTRSSGSRAGGGASGERNASARRCARAARGLPAARRRERRASSSSWSGSSRSSASSSHALVGPQDWTAKLARVPSRSETPGAGAPGSRRRRSGSAPSSPSGSCASGKASSTSSSSCRRCSRPGSTRRGRTSSTRTTPTR